MESISIVSCSSAVGSNGNMGVNNRNSGNMQGVNNRRHNGPNTNRGAWSDQKAPGGGPPMMGGNMPPDGFMVGVQTTNYAALK